MAAVHDKQTIAATGYESQVGAAFKDLDQRNFIRRLWQKDATLWSKNPAEQKTITNALGWLTIADAMAGQAKELASFADEVREAGFRDVVLLGMGGSSQSADLFAATFPSAPGYPKLHVLDSTVPDTIRAVDRNIDITRTLFVVASKTGGTIETQSHCAAFFERVKAKSVNRAGSNFVAITDPGTHLASFAEANYFRRVFLTPPDIIGCYAVMSYFGLVPAAIAGIDVVRLEKLAGTMMHSCGADVPPQENPGVMLGLALGEAARGGCRRGGRPD